ncbi:hypothetical protein [Jiella marina]|uniref:hypothetical protein n=1 Tax=Jiella sp. LLJ827 TaxID=2917712 RepID=UPI0021009966|nr:hypothetical protein [Jiella sp. LLJ827]MCQ0988156.1 hypothetical protein [Jiella sp. LLJ827]
MARVDFDEADEALLEGALAYVENDIRKAERLLSSLDVDEMEPVFGAQVNLAVAQLVEKKDPAEALNRLERVMLDAPGTLLEEAALRLGVMLAEHHGDTDKADRYARLYFDRYYRSVYAGNFRARFSSVYVARPAGSEEKTIATIADAVTRIPPDQQIDIYLSIGRRALVAGNLKLCGMAADEAMKIGNVSKSARQRAQLYQAASTLTERDTTETLASLKAINRDELHVADQKLLDAAFGVLGEIRKPLMTDRARDPEDLMSETALDTSVLDRANSVLDAVRNDLKELDQ